MLVIDNFLWMLAGLFSGYIFYELIDFFSNMVYNRRVSKYIKYNIIFFIMFFAFLRGCTGNDLQTNITKLL